MNVCRTLQRYLLVVWFSLLDTIVIANPNLLPPGYVQQRLANILHPSNNAFQPSPTNTHDYSRAIVEQEAMISGPRTVMGTPQPSSINHVIAARPGIPYSAPAHIQEQHTERHRLGHHPAAQFSMQQGRAERPTTASSAEPPISTKIDPITSRMQILEDIHSVREHTPPVIPSYPMTPPLQLNRQERSSLLSAAYSDPPQQQRSTSAAKTSIIQKPNSVQIGMCGEQGMNCIVDTTVKCTKTSILVTLRFATPFNGLIHIWGKRDCLLHKTRPGRHDGPLLIPLSLTKATCPSYTGFSPAINDVPPESLEATEDPSNFRGRKQYRITVQFDPEIESVEDVNFVVRCRHPKASDDSTGLAFHIADKLHLADQVKDKRFKVILRHATNERFFRSIKGPVQQGDSLLLQILWKKTKDPEERKSLVVSECLAFDGSLPPPLRRASIRLVKNGCSVLPAIMGNFKNAEHGSSLSAIALLRAFKVGTAGSVLLRCKVNLCSGKCIENECNDNRMNQVIDEMNWEKMLGYKGDSYKHGGGFQARMHHGHNFPHGVYIDSYVFEKMIFFDKHMPMEDAASRHRRGAEPNGVSLDAWKSSNRTAFMSTECHGSSRVEAKFTRLSGFTGTVELRPFFAPEHDASDRAFFHQCRAIATIDGSQEVTSLSLSIDGKCGLAPNDEPRWYILKLSTPVEVQEILVQCPVELTSATNPDEIPVTDYEDFFD